MVQISASLLNVYVLKKYIMYLNVHHQSQSASAYLFSLKITKEIYLPVYTKQAL